MRVSWKVTMAAFMLTTSLHAYVTTNDHQNPLLNRAPANLIEINLDNIEDIKVSVEDSLKDPQGISLDNHKDIKVSVEDILKDPQGITHDEYKSRSKSIGAIIKARKQDQFKVEETLEANQAHLESLESRKKQFTILNERILIHIASLEKIEGSDSTELIQELKDHSKALDLLAISNNEEEKKIINQVELLASKDLPVDNIDQAPAPKEDAEKAQVVKQDQDPKKVDDQAQVDVQAQGPKKVVSHTKEHPHYKPLLEGTIASGLLKISDSESEVQNTSQEDFQKKLEGLNEYLANVDKKIEDIKVTDSITSNQESVEALKVLEVERLEIMKQLEKHISDLILVSFAGDKSQMAKDFSAITQELEKRLAEINTKKEELESKNKELASDTKEGATPTDILAAVLTPVKENSVKCEPKQDKFADLQEKLDTSNKAIDELNEKLAALTDSNDEDETEDEDEDEDGEKYLSKKEVRRKYERKIARQYDEYEEYLNKRVLLRESMYALNEQMQAPMPSQMRRMHSPRWQDNAIDYSRLSPFYGLEKNRTSFTDLLSFGNDNYSIEKFLNNGSNVTINNYTDSPQNIYGDNAQFARNPSSQALRGDEFSNRFSERFDGDGWQIRNRDAYDRATMFQSFKPVDLNARAIAL